MKTTEDKMAIEASTKKARASKRPWVGLALSLALLFSTLGFSSVVSAHSGFLQPRTVGNYIIAVTAANYHQSHHAYCWQYSNSNGHGYNCI